MSNNNYISNLLNLKDPNLIFDKVFKENINDNEVTVIYVKLVNKPDICPHCGGDSINIHGYKQSTIIDIVENRQLAYLKKYFRRYNKKARKAVKEALINSPKQIRRINQCFPNISFYLLSSQKSHNSILQTLLF